MGAAGRKDGKPSCDLPSFTVSWALPLAIPALRRKQWQNQRELTVILCPVSLCH